MQELKFGPILKTLIDHNADFIVVGGISAVLQGTPITTFDLDVVHSRAPQNFPRLLAALDDLEAIYRYPAHRRLKPNNSHLASKGHQLLTTRYGDFDLLGTIHEGLGYEELLPDSVKMEAYLGVIVNVLNLEKLIEVKEKAGRDKDKAALPILRSTLQESKRLRQPPR